MIELPRGASDAALAPYHVDRSKICVRERFAFNPLIDPDRLARNIELTRFPVPDDEDHAETDTEAAFVRAADLIGQLGDPLYPRKLNALFHEFEEIGVNKLWATPRRRTWRTTIRASSGPRSNRSSARPSRPST